MMNAVAEEEPTTNSFEACPPVGFTVKTPNGVVEPRASVEVKLFAV
jgi:hypothetical protein